MLGVYQLLTEKEVRSRIRKQEEEFRREKACKEAHRVRCTHISDESESEEVDHDEPDTNHYNFVPEHQDYEATPHAEKREISNDDPWSDRSSRQNENYGQRRCFYIDLSCRGVGP